jgi:hypothetical protein
MEYVPGQSLDEYFDELVLSDFVCPEDVALLSLNELVELVKNVQMALNHLVQHRDFFDWAVGQLMTKGLITEGEAVGFIQNVLRNAGASAAVLRLFDVKGSTSLPVTPQTATITAGS